MKRSGHGQSCRGKWTPTYYSWAAMIQRCTNPSRNVYNLYGGRGICVCDEWKNFTNFFDDMGERPVGCSLDRINCDGDYTPANCKWHSYKTQARNRRNNKLSIEAAAEIRSRYEVGNISSRRLAAIFGVSKTMILFIVNGRQWT